MTSNQTNLPKRFYTSVSTEADGDGWAVTLDGRIPKTPDKRNLTLPTKALAAAVAEEWEGQAERLDIPNMHLTRLANVALDRTPGQREDMAGEVAKYAGTDLVCYLADGPSALRERQVAIWGPVRDWADAALGVSLIPTEGVGYVPQAEASLQRAYEVANELDDFRLTGLNYAIGLYGSAVLGLAVLHDHLSEADALEASLIDERWQMEQWGEDAEELARIAALKAQSITVGCWFSNLSANSTD